jgi:SSS family solute:Na+ symporter
LNHSGLHTVDFIVVIGYFLLVFAIAGILILRDRKKSSEKASAQYFLGGRNMGWFIVGASLFASNIGSEHLVGLAGAGASGDFPAAQFEIIAAFMLLLLGWLFVPFYLRSGVFTMPEFLEKRYDAWSRGYLSWVSIIGYVLTKISVTIAAGGIIFTALLGIDFWTGAIVVVVATGLYTIFGGLKAVVYTDMIQMFILLGGSLAVTYYGFQALGGWENLSHTVDASYLNLWRDSNDSAFPWTGILFGAPILGVWYWCTDQFIVQRVLAAKNIQEARKGTIFAGYLKLLPMFIFVLPGVLAYALSTGANPVLTFPVENGETVYDAALPVMTLQLLPIGVRGLVVAGLLAALMSSLSSVFNSCSTLFTIDIYKKYFPDTSEKKLVRIGQIATGLLVILGLAWIPFLRILDGGLFQKLQSIQSYISPPIAAVFLLGLFYKKINAKGAKYALIFGAIVGGLRLILELSNPSFPVVFSWFIDMNFLHFAVFLFVLSSLVLIGVSSIYKSDYQVDSNLIFQRTAGLVTLEKLNLSLSALLVGLIIMLWYVFS